MRQGKVLILYGTRINADEGDWSTFDDITTNRPFLSFPGAFESALGSHAHSHHSLVSPTRSLHFIYIYIVRWDDALC